jgi:hypothetical protein
MRLVIGAALLLISAALPDGWKARVDGPDSKEEAITVEEKESTLTVTTRGVGTILYKPDMKAEGNYELTAVFSELEPAKTPQAYGFFVGGRDLDKAVPNYATYLIRHDGMFSVQRVQGSKSRSIVAWRTALTMKEPKRVQATNTLSIRAAGNTVRFYVDDKEVAKLSRAQIGDGIAGIRVNPGLHLQVHQITVKQLK